MDEMHKDSAPVKERERPRAFLALKFGQPINEQHGEALITALEETGLEVSCLVRDEEWGKHPSEHPVQEAFRRIDQSDILVIDASGETGFGMGAEAGYAKALGRTVILTCPEGTEMKLTRRDVADIVVTYKDLNHLSQKLKTIVQGLKKQNS